MPPECPAMATVFVTRALPFPALDRLRRRTTSTSGPATCRPGRMSCAPRAREADALLTLVTDRVDAELLDAAPG